ncbi:MAG: NAD(P)/FAD-dependent oxidoreductase [Actinomycetota bacterium]|nr:NAD(P)/FAD-dependent oxidoreductase [Actinomycetota bacterium]
MSSSRQTTQPEPDTGPGAPPAADRPREVTVIVIGSGFAGIAMAVELSRRGLTDFVVLERADDVGGTWRDNTYPGAACDVPSHLYSFSFAPNPAWTRSFSTQPEIQRYLQQVAREYDVYPRCMFGADLQQAAWDPLTLRWTVHTGRGSFRAPFLVSGTGGLSDPAPPAIAGLDTFGGPVFHSARWRHDVDLTGRRVAVIGTGASAVQIVPAVAEEVAHLDVYQRTAPWVVPRADRDLTRAERWLFTRVPSAERLLRLGIYGARESYVIGFAKRPQLARVGQRMAERHLNAQVADPALRDRLRPDYAFGCKRVLLSNDYYPTLLRRDVELVDAAIAEIRPGVVVTADAIERPADVIVLATGFRITDPPSAHLIQDGHGGSLAERWRNGMHALRGTTVSGFPNLFLIIGPNTGLGHTSMVYMIESQVAYISDAIRTVRARGLGAIEPDPAAQRRYNARLQAQLGGTVWNSGGCRSWYLDARGRNTTIWPDFTFRFRRQTRRIDLAEYRCLSAG